MYTIELDTAKAAMYNPVTPKGAEVIGVITNNIAMERGALVKLANGQYVKMNAGITRTLHQREVAQALNKLK
jgi:hypothetical protein